MNIQTNTSLPDLFPGSLSRKLLLMALTVLTIVCFANSVPGKFIYDDVFQVETNRVVQEGSISDIFTSKIFYGAEGIGFGFYRPVQALMFKLDYYLWGLVPEGYHITNIMLHLSVVLLMFPLCLRITGGNNFISFFVSAVYAVHPMHATAVSYISGRADSMVFVLLLVMGLLWMPGTGGKAYFLKRTAGLIIVYISYLTAVFTKPLALFFPVLLVLYEYCFSGRDGYERLTARKMVKYLPFAAIAFAYYLAVTGLFPGEALMKGTTTIAERTILFFRAFFDYVTMSVLPVVHRMDWKYPPSLVTGDMVLLCGLFTAGFLAVCSWLWKKGAQHTGLKILFFGMAWFFLAIMPQSNVFITQNAPIAEHWLYIPLFGFVLCAVYAVSMAAGRTGLYAKTRIGIFFAAVVVAFAALTVRQNANFKDEYSFFSYIVRVNPNSGTAHNNLGAFYYSTGDKEKAYLYFKRAVELEPYQEFFVRNFQRLKKETGR